MPIVTLEMVERGAEGYTPAMEFDLAFKTVLLKLVLEFYLGPFSNDFSLLKDLDVPIAILF